jgi:predicted DNA-binding transcriptional regulator AlpA
MQTAHKGRERSSEVLNWRAMGLSAAEPASHPVLLDPRLLAEIADRLSDAIVERVVEAIRAEGIIPQGRASTPWLDAKEVADLLGVDRDWVYEHADELGASRIGSGPRPRLRFPPDILERLDGHRASSEPANEPAQRRPKSSGLIPIRAS